MSTSGNKFQKLVNMKNLSLRSTSDPTLQQPSLSLAPARSGHQKWTAAPGI